MAQTLPLAPLAGARTRPRFRDWTRARGAKIARRIPAQEPTESGAVGPRRWRGLQIPRAWQIGALRDFGTESKALQAHRFQASSRSSRSTTAPKTPRFHSSSRARARARQNRGRASAGTDSTPPALSASRANASRARRACVPLPLSGAATHPPNPLGGSRLMGKSAGRLGIPKAEQSQSPPPPRPLVVALLCAPAFARAQAERTPRRAFACVSCGSWGFCLRGLRAHVHWGWERERHEAPR